MRTGIEQLRQLRQCQRREQFSLGLGLGLEEVFVFDSKSENRDRAVEAVEAVSERVRVRVCEG